MPPSQVLRGLTTPPERESTVKITNRTGKRVAVVKRIKASNVPNLWVELLECKHALVVTVRQGVQKRRLCQACVAKTDTVHAALSRFSHEEIMAALRTRGRRIANLRGVKKAAPKLTSVAS